MKSINKSFKSITTFSYTGAVLSGCPVSMSQLETAGECMAHDILLTDVDYVRDHHDG